MLKDFFPEHKIENGHGKLDLRHSARINFSKSIQCPHTQGKILNTRQVSRFSKITPESKEGYVTVYFSKELFRPIYTKIFPYACRHCSDKCSCYAKRPVDKK